MTGRSVPVMPNSPDDMMSRLSTMVLMGIKLPLEAVMRQIASRNRYPGTSGTPSGQEQESIGNHGGIGIMKRRNQASTVIFLSGDGK